MNNNKQVLHLNQESVNRLSELMKQGNNHHPKTMKELFTVLKDSGIKQRNSMKENEPKKKAVVSPRVATDIIKKYVITANIGTNQKELENSPLYFYDLDRGIYSYSNKTIDRIILSIEPSMTERNRKEIKSWLNIESKNLEPNQDTNLIPVNNGIYDKNKNKLLAFNPKYVFTTKVATDYLLSKIHEPIFKGWSITAWIKQLSNNDGEKEKLIWQMIATAIQNPPSGNTAFFLVDNQQGRTGKSTFEELLINLVGEENYTALRVKQFDERFSIANIYGASLVIGDDNNPNEYIEDSSNFKSTISGDRIPIEFKGTQPFTYKPNITTVQSMNGIPRFKDNTNGVYRRIRVIKFNHQYPDTPDGRLIKSKYIKNDQLLQFVLKKGLETDISTIVSTKESKEALDELKVDSNPIYAFYKEVVKELTSSRIPANFLYKLYKKYCDDNNLKYIPTQNKFTRELKIILSVYGYKYEAHCRPTVNFTHNDYQLIGYDDYDDKKYPSYINKVQSCFIKC